MNKISIKKFGGELSIIDKIIRPIAGKKPIIMGPGDDSAVLDNNPDPNMYTVISSDMYSNGDHFSTQYFTPIQIGSKVMEASLSDIAAMGGKPQYATMCISLKPQLHVAFVRSLYRGIYKSCDFHGVHLIGGDIIKSSQINISITVIGQVPKKYLKSRKGAKVGDLIKVTGPVGGASVGYQLFKRKYFGHSETKRCHTDPIARIDLVDQITPYAHAMQDISDGIGSELHHICSQSSVGAMVFEKKLPIENYVILSSRAMKINAIDMALYGGEDYELIYTINPKDDNKTPGVVIGEITPAKGGLQVVSRDGSVTYELQKGFQHF